MDVVVNASRYGATQGIAEFIAERLQAQGIPAERPPISRWRTHAV